MEPYHLFSNFEASEKILAGYRMDKPNDCPADVYEIMKKCWEEEPEKRPTFAQIIEMIEQVLSGKPNTMVVVKDTGSFYTLEEHPTFYQV